MDHYYHFNATQLRTWMDEEIFHGSSDGAPNRCYVELPNGDVYHVGGTWLDDDDAEESNDD